jgi:membrane-bound lytic murein transglycosylase F
MLKKVLFVIVSIAAFMLFETSQGQSRDYVVLNEEDVMVVEAESTQNNDVQDAASAELPFIISKFDSIMQEIALEQGQDWRLMSAIAYNESRFIENLVSKQGATGIMQIRPVVARHFNIPVEQISDTPTNIRLAGMLLTELDGMLRIPASTSTQDRLSIVIASYNAGIGHILDACRLARSEGANPNSWGDVSRYLKLMSDPEYYQRDVVRYGKFTGSAQTLGYVREVMKTYNEYCRMTS